MPYARRVELASFYEYLVACRYLAYAGPGEMNVPVVQSGRPTSRLLGKATARREGDSQRTGIQREGILLRKSANVDRSRDE